MMERRDQGKKAFIMAYGSWGRRVHGGVEVQLQAAEMVAEQETENSHLNLQTQRREREVKMAVKL